MKQIIFSFLAFITCYNAIAQINLVKNGDFEQRDTCPYLIDQIKVAKYWSSIDTDYVSSADPFFGRPYCTPEYINTCTTNSGCGAPSNALFFQYPRSGSGMMNVGVYDNDSLSAGSYAEKRRDYMTGRLSTALTAGQSYCVTFFVVTANTAAYAINHIGAYLDNGSIDTTTTHCGWPHMEYTPQVLSTTIINDTLNWTMIQGSFIANGTEKYITIGNFFDTANTGKIRRNSGFYSTYEIDDVSVIASGTNAFAGPDKNINKWDSTYLGVTSNGGGMPCYWYLLGGTAPIDSGGTIKVKPTSTTSYVVAMDLCGTITYDTVTVNVNTTGIMPAPTKAAPLIYPNPATTKLTIEQAAGCEVCVDDMMGRVLVNRYLSEDKTALDLSALPAGIYMVQVTDKETGMRYTQRVVKE